MSKNCQLQHLTLLCAAMEDSFNLLNYEWSDLEDDVSPSRRVRYSPVKNGESSGIELSSSLEIDMDSLVYQPLMLSSPTVVTSTSETVTPAAVSFTAETVTSARPASPIIWTTPIPTSTTTVPVPAPTGNPTAVPLWMASLQAMSTGGAELKTSPRSAAAALAPPPITEPSAPLPAPVMSPGPASAAAVQGEVICSALGCMVMGTTEALGTHWLDLHEVEKMLWLCPMPRCHMKSRSSGMLDIHLRVRHKASRPVARRLREEIPPLVDWVINRKYQFPGVARPLFVILPALSHGALAFNMKETVITEVAAIFPKGSTQGPSSVPQAPAVETLVSTQDAKQPRQVTSVGSWYEFQHRHQGQLHQGSCRRHHKNLHHCRRLCRCPYRYHHQPQLHFSRKPDGLCWQRPVQCKIASLQLHCNQRMIPHPLTTCGGTWEAWTGPSRTCCGSNARQRRQHSLRWRGNTSERR